jgi:hypothetical protein
LIESKSGVRKPLVEAHTFLGAFGYVIVTTSIVLMGIGEHKWESESKQSKKNRKAHGYKVLFGVGM